MRHFKYPLWVPCALIFPCKVGPFLVLRLFPLVVSSYFCNCWRRNQIVCLLSWSSIFFFKGGFHRCCGKGLFTSKTYRCYPYFFNFVSHMGDVFCFLGVYEEKKLYHLLTLSYFGMAFCDERNYLLV